MGEVVDKNEIVKCLQKRLEAGDIEFSLSPEEMSYIIYLIKTDIAKQNADEDDLK